MTEPIIGSVTQANEPKDRAEKKTWRHKPLLSVLFSLLCPGLGQVYNSELAKGFGIAFASFVLISLTFTHLFASFMGLVLALLMSLSIQICAGLDSFFNARRIRHDGEFSRKSLAARILTAIVILGIELAVTSDYALKHFYPLHAFKVPSASMCPTVCEGDRVIANLNSFRRISPHRGDVVLFLYQDGASLHVKRVAAVGGDTVSASNSRLLINGIPVSAPRSACGTSTDGNEDYSVPQQFVPGLVPPNHLFLLGDNEGNSYDSRYYGTVDASRIKGRLLYLFWSWRRERIGCVVK